MTAYSLTLASANTNYNLLTLARAILTTLVDLPGTWTVRADEGNTDSVLVGGPATTDLTTSNYAGKLVAGESVGVKSLKGVWVRSASPGMLVSVSRSV